MTKQLTFLTKDLVCLRVYPQQTSLNAFFNKSWFKYNPGKQVIGGVDIVEYWRKTINPFGTQNGNAALK